MASEPEFRTSNLDEMVAFVTRLLRPFSASGRTQRYDARLGRHEAAGLVFLTGQYGAEVELDAPSLDSCYVVQRALSGGFRARSLGAELPFGERELHVINPFAPLRMRWSRDCRLAITRVDRARLEQHASALAGEPVKEIQILPEALPSTAGAARSLFAYFDYLYRESSRPESPLRGGAGARYAEQTFLTLLLATRVGCRVPESPPRDCGAMPYYVKRAEELIEARLMEDIGIIDIVAAAGVSARTLQYGFRRCRGMGPIAWLRSRRLERAYRDLSLAEPGAVTVTEVALRLGFLHLGKFSAAYRARFGEPPSATLRR